MSKTSAFPLVALVILDGWGIAPPSEGNAVTQASTPCFDELWERFPHGQMSASGSDVGLPEGQMGNSEVGHLNLGAGRVVYQDLARINASVSDGSLASNFVLCATLSMPELQREVEPATLHVIGLVSTGGVHSHISHIEGLIAAAAAQGVQRIAIHAITDGRDVSPSASLHDIPRLEEFARNMGSSGLHCEIASVVGRYWAMDRDKRWDRIERAYRLMVDGAGSVHPTPTDAVKHSHEAGTTDEFIEPSWCGSAEPWKLIRPGDTVLCANFRPDRMRQICHALADPKFAGFERTDLDVKLVTMTQYDDVLAAPVIFGVQMVAHTLADVLEAANVHQLHVAETEKYAHVTYFFNGGVERIHDGEVRRLTPSVRDVATYDMRPEMSATHVADECIGALEEDPAIRFIMLNFANPDMVGHTGSIPATIAAVTHVDGQLRRIVDAVSARGGACFITADHGNAEQMLADDGSPHTAHTTNPVPVVVTAPTADDVRLSGMMVRDGGKLADVSPTVLHLLGFQRPPDMTGNSLLVQADTL